MQDKHRLRVLENSVLRKIFGPKRDKVMKEWKQKLHNEELMTYTAHQILFR